MKNSPHVGRAAMLAALVLVFAAATVMAQDPVKVAPNNFKVLLENDQVRVLDFHSKHGEKIGMHSHPNSAYYYISGTKTKFTSPDGKVEEREGTAGQAAWRDAETHASEYIGPGESHVVLVELKGKAAKAASKAAPKKK